LLYFSRSPRALHSFPTRRSSDLTRGKFPFRYLTTILLSLHPTTLSQANSLQQPGILPHSPFIDSSIPLAIRDKSKCVRLSASTVDRKSTRLNSSHVKISYAVFCL